MSWLSRTWRSGRVTGRVTRVGTATKTKTRKRPKPAAPRCVRCIYLARRSASQTAAPTRQKKLFEGFGLTEQFAMVKGCPFSGRCVEEPRKKNKQRGAQAGRGQGALRARADGGSAVSRVAQDVVHAGALGDGESRIGRHHRRGASPSCPSTPTCHCSESLSTKVRMCTTRTGTGGGERGGQGHG